MKRVLTVLVLLSGACVLHAEEMKFVTTLSSPLGTFAQLETADYSATTSVPLLNFCNTRSSAGTVALKGADTYLQTLSLKNGTTLGGNTPEYRISGTLSVNNNSEVTGGRLLANAATVSGSSSAKSKVEDTLYAASLKVKGAKAVNLTIPGQVQTSGQGGDDELEWSNIYTKDYKSDGSTTGSNSYTSYLLKTKGTPEPECNLTWADCITDTEWRDFDEENCQCIDRYLLQYKEMTFAATGYECLGKNSFFITNIGGRRLYPEPNYSQAQDVYNLDSSPFTYNAWYGLERKKPRDLIYQCVFRKNTRIKKLSCDLGDLSCIENLCKNSPAGTVFLRDDQFFMNNLTQVKAGRPMGLYGENSDRYHCDNELRGPAMSSNGNRGNRPCLAFNFLQFWVCDKNGNMDFSMFADDSQSSWEPNASFAELP
ncbi:hypothetical protein [Candidatus Avelusimicrobium alvi]|uniref:hypothetical protein n=1 Tax=Candidatus Avelusimicrobium alvi TaxID=3416221 RepID=UPI003D0989F1